MASSLYSLVQRGRILGRWQRSGLSAAEFSLRVDVSASTLYAWRGSMAQEGAAPLQAADTLAAGAFVELVPAAAAPPTLSMASAASIADASRCDAAARALDAHADAVIVAHAGVEVLVQSPLAAGGQLAVRLHAGFDCATLLRTLDALHMGGRAAASAGLVRS
jgi:hypothetical protein